MTAKEAIEAFTVQFKGDNPLAFKESQHKSGSGCAVVIVLLVAGTIAITKIPESYRKDWAEHLKTLLQTVPDKIPNSETTAAVPKAKPQIADDLPPSQAKMMPNPVDRNAVFQAMAPSPAADRDSPYQPIAPPDPETDLTALYRQKLANSDYVAWMNKPGIPLGYQDFTEEHYIKFIRAKIAKNLALPAKIKPLKIPVVSAVKVNLDGAIQDQEWQQAVAIPLQPETTGSMLYLQADENWLYLAADVPGDTTPNGFDQFRFYIHVDIDPLIRNERIHVGRGGLETLGGIRQTQVIWQGDPPTNDNQRWKKSPISEWRIYRLAKGASTLHPHRQFEAKLNLKESGLTIGSPLPVFAEIETDPLYVDGKFNQRRYLGALGSQDQPVWMMMK